MLDMLSRATIGELFSELAQVERRNDQNLWMVLGLVT